MWQGKTSRVLENRVMLTDAKPTDPSTDGSWKGTWTVWPLSLPLPTTSDLRGWRAIFQSPNFSTGFSLPDLHVDGKSSWQLFFKTEVSCVYGYIMVAMVTVPSLSLGHAMWQTRGPYLREPHLQTLTRGAGSEVFPVDFSPSGSRMNKRCLWSGFLRCSCVTCPHLNAPPPVLWPCFLFFSPGFGWTKYSKAKSAGQLGLSPCLSPVLLAEWTSAGYSTNLNLNHFICQMEIIRAPTL